MPDHLPGSIPRFKPSSGPDPAEGTFHSHPSPHTLHTQYKNESHIAATLVLWYHQESNRDTRIFSPLLYQLSYGTIAIIRREIPSVLSWCKGKQKI